MEIKNTGFEWCVIDKINPLKLIQWDTKWDFCHESFYEEKITHSEYLRRIKMCVTESSIPVKAPLYLEYRMYGLVPYNLSSIQKSIQFGHAVVEYGQLMNNMPLLKPIYNKWANNDKTFIIYNGRTTNENIGRLGKMQESLQILKDNGIFVAEFREPDLNDTLTAIVFLVDERVFNKKLYPDFVIDTLNSKDNETQYNEWCDAIGKENVFLRTFLSNFTFA